MLAAVLAELNSNTYTERERYAEWHIQPCLRQCCPVVSHGSASVPGTPPTTEGGLSVGAESKQGRGRERERETSEKENPNGRVASLDASQPRIPLALRMAESESSKQRKVQCALWSRIKSERLPSSSSVCCCQCAPSALPNGPHNSSSSCIRKFRCASLLHLFLLFLNSVRSRSKGSSTRECSAVPCSNGNCPLPIVVPGGEIISSRILPPVPLLELLCMQLLINKNAAE